jgi:endoglucanase
VTTESVRTRKKQSFQVTFLLVLSAAVLAACTCAGPVVAPTATPQPPPTPEVTDPFAQNQRLGRGMNMGNALEMPRGQWGINLREEHFEAVAQAGFDHVRIPIRWSAHAEEEAPYTIDPGFFERVDLAVDQALSQGLLVMIDVHHYQELVEAPEEHRERFLALWEQIAAHYQDYSNDLLFEIFNEPEEELTAFVWNDLLIEALAVIRQTNPDRFVVIGPPKWNIVWELSKLELPEDDRRIIVTVHYYSPMEVTHQGANWVEGGEEWLGTTWEGTDAERREIDSHLNIAANWGLVNDRPIHLGEFGVIDQADEGSRARWTGYVVQEAERLGMSWAYWEFGAGFAAYDLAQAQWNEDMLAALMPEKE